MKVKPIHVFNSDGTRRADYLFTSLFDVMPSTYAVKIDNSDEFKIDLVKITNDFVKKLFPNGYTYSARCRMIEDEVSCAAKRDKDKIIYQREYVDGSGILYNTAKVILILPDECMVVTILGSSIEVIYDLDLTSEGEVEKFTDDLISKLPMKKVDVSATAIELVAFDGDLGYYTIDAEINNVNIDIEKNYNDDFKPIYDNIVNFIESEERKSGLIVLNGEPGTGKTYFIRHLVSNTSKPYILIPPSIASSMSSPEFVSFFIEHMNSVFILEDCESVIKERSANDFANAVSSLLNMSDGLMSDIFNGKFICTFNADIASVDDAILRKGRCFAKYEFGKLCEEKAQALLKERGFDVKDCGDMTLADIYNYEVEVDTGKSGKKIGF